MATVTMTTHGTVSPSETFKTTARKRKFSISIPARAVNGHISSLPSASSLRSNADESYNSGSEEDTNNSIRRRGGSTASSTDQDTQIANTSDHQSDTTSNPRKRGSPDHALDYPRRRATIACEMCRGRKSKCTGEPRCRLCTELNAECVYREPGVKLDAGDKLILERLTRIEGLLQTNSVGQQTPVISLRTNSPTNSNGPGSSREEFLARAVEGFDRALSLPAAGLGTWQNSSVAPSIVTNISTMPKGHTTPGLHLLQWSMIRELVSRPYDPQHLLQLELSREPLNLNPAMSLDLTNTGAYVQAFFDRANVWYACVNPYSWRAHYRTALTKGFREGPESCVTLLVLALGAASLGGSISSLPKDKDPPGMPYFAHAWQLLPSLMTQNNTLSSQCLILASAYLFYLVRPLDAWNLLGSSSMKLQLLLSGQGRIPGHSKELTERVYWNAVLFESDLLAELDLPHSGIIQFEETVGLPCGFEEEDDEPAGRDELWYFLAEIALRRLLNRVSHVIYSKGAPTSTIVLEPVVAELDFQLKQWYDGLPIALQFPYSHTPQGLPEQTVLRLRYFACRSIIFRKYVLAVLENEQAILDPAVRENCRKCLEASVRQLECIRAYHAGHLPYLWQGALSMVSQTLLVMGATLSPSLSALLPPAQAMDEIIYAVVVEMEKYAHLAPSLRMSADIIREAEERRMIMLRSAGMR